METLRLLLIYLKKTHVTSLIRTSERE